MFTAALGCILCIIREASIIRGEDSSVLRSSTLLRCVICVMLLLLPNMAGYDQPHVLKDVKPPSTSGVDALVNSKFREHLFLNLQLLSNHQLTYLTPILTSSTSSKVETSSLILRKDLYTLVIIEQVLPCL